MEYVNKDSIVHAVAVPRYAKLERFNDEDDPPLGFDIKIICHSGVRE
jgi:hypothetical protein